MKWKTNNDSILTTAPNVGYGRAVRLNVLASTSNFQPLLRHVSDLQTKPPTKPVWNVWQLLRDMHGLQRPCARPWTIFLIASASLLTRPKVSSKPLGLPKYAMSWTQEMGKSLRLCHLHWILSFWHSEFQPLRPRCLYAL